MKCARVPIILFLCVGLAQAQRCSLTTSQAQKVFELDNVFDQTVTLEPFDDETRLPWWVLGPEGKVLAVIETIEPSNEGSPNTVLDAQLIDGSDLKVAVPLAASNLKCKN